MIDTPYYLLDQQKIIQNMEKIYRLRTASGAKILLALKCFATWSAFDFMRDYLDGTTSSSLNEVRLGRERFGKETHAYSVAYSDAEIDAVVSHADKIIFNSASQLERFADRAAGIVRGLRINPGISASGFDLADPARPFSRLGEADISKIRAASDRVSGFMFHFNCENGDFELFNRMLGRLEESLGSLLGKMEWISLGGGIDFTREGYPVDALGQRLKQFARKHDVQVYLEPGQACVTDAATLETTVVDTFFNGKNIAIVDSSLEAHLLDLLIYRLPAEVRPDTGEHRYMVCGNSCLAGDIFGEFRFADKLKVGDRISFQDSAAYSMVKKNWFNGVRMPAIAIRQTDGNIRLVKEFGYRDYEASLS